MPSGRVWTSPGLLQSFVVCYISAEPFSELSVQSPSRLPSNNCPVTFRVPTLSSGGTFRPPLISFSGLRALSNLTEITSDLPGFIQTSRKSRKSPERRFQTFTKYGSVLFESIYV